MQLRHLHFMQIVAGREADSVVTLSSPISHSWKLSHQKVGPCLFDVVRPLRRSLNAELANGRLAMIAIFWMWIQDSCHVARRTVYTILEDGFVRTDICWCLVLSCSVLVAVKLCFPAIVTLSGYALCLSAFERNSLYWYLCIVDPKPPWKMSKVFDKHPSKTPGLEEVWPNPGCLPTPGSSCSM